MSYQSHTEGLRFHEPVGAIVGKRGIYLKGGKWPAALPEPDFGLWRGQVKRSAVRNLCTLLLLENGVAGREVSDLLNLTPSRTLAVAKATRARVFGPNHAFLARSRAWGDPGVVARWGLFETDWPTVSARAILYCIQYLQRAVGDMADLRLLEATLDLLKLNDVALDLPRLGFQLEPVSDEAAALVAFMSGPA